MCRTKRPIRTGLGMFAGGLALACTTAAQADLLITEIMFDPAGGNEHEYVELYNNGATDVDLTGYDLVDESDNISTLAGGMVTAGGTAVLIRNDSARNLQRYQDAWGSDINFVETPYGTWPNYSNGGSGVILRDTSDTILAEVSYENGTNGWPGSNDAASIYLTDPDAANPGAASNWALSVAGTDGAYEAGSPRVINGVPDVGSPGFVPGVVPEPTSALLASTGLAGLLLRRRRRA